MQEESFANQPLLYIDQKETRNIFTNMQAHYFTSHSLQFPEDMQETEGQLPESVTTILGKIQTALTTKEQVPNIKYTIETKEETYRAIIQAYENENLSIVDERGVSSLIPISSIKNIEAISL